MSKGPLIDILKLTISVFSVLNPIGAIPVFLALTAQNSKQEIYKIANTCAITVSITLLVALFFGTYILDFFGITIASFRVGAGILIAGMALSMLSGKQQQAKISQEELENQMRIREIGIVPLAIPLLSGPGSMSTIIIHSDHFNTPVHWIGAVVAIIVIGILVKIILRSSRRIGSRLGKIGVNVLSRVMGLILLAISIEVIADGIKRIFPGLS